MNVLEIKNNLVKIAYEAEDNLALSGFVVIQDVNTPYVAQVMNLKADAASNFAIVKLLFTFNEEGILKNYNGTIPSLKSTVTKLPSNELLDIIPIDNPLQIGVLAEQETVLSLDKSILNNNLLVCSNNTDNTSRLINNFVRQIKEKCIIFDTEGNFEFGQKIKFGKDFRLPLNYDLINFIYDNDLDDVDATSRAIIQDIFIEVQEYTKTLPEGYLPFETFLNVVDQQYRETKITQLVLLKNKLLKYKELNVFAQTLKDILNFTIAVEQNDILTVDISDMPAVLQKEILSYAYTVLAAQNFNIYSFVKADNENTNKKLLKTFLQRNNVFTTIICPHEYKYLNLLKENAQNMILFAPLTLQHDFASYNTFMNKLNADEFIIYGAHTQNIPLIVELPDSFEEDKEMAQEPESVEKTEETIQEDLTPQSVEPELENIEIQEPEQDQIEEEPHIEDEELEISVEEPNVIETEENEETEEDTISDYPENIEYPDITIEEPIDITESETDSESEVIEQLNTEETVIPNILEDNEDETVIDETVIEDGEDTQIEDIKVEPLFDDTLIETTNSEITIDEQEINEITAPESTEHQSHDEIVEQVAKDIDKALYEKIDDNETVSLEDFNADELTEDDLNLIDDINSDSTPDIDFNEGESASSVLPIYPGEESDNDNSQKFEPGDRVSTPKYGEGVVEKMIKYGNKMLCSIEFPNIGRRLLDPSMSDITKLS